LTKSVIYAIFLIDFSPARGVFLIQKNKSSSLQADSTVVPGAERRIPLLHGTDDPFSCVSESLQLVEENLVRAVRSRELDLTRIASHLIDSGGKRVRPMVTLLAYFAFGGQRTQDIVDIATAIELIHTATLLHDDIIDGAETRRGKESAFKKFGLKSTLVTGDFLFIKAFEFAGKFDETVVQWTADACTLLTEGEILQGHFNRNRAVTVEDYLEIVKRKTASLFHTGAKVGAYLAGAHSSLVDEAESYGLNMGIAFQMVDDILDVVGHIDLLGKPIGMDLRDGNPALPIILSVIDGDPATIGAFENGKPTEAQINAALDSIKTGSSIQEAKSLSKRYAREALKAVKKLPPSMYRNGLKSLVQLIIDRDF
jgi:octaprenyl-diphosphate synthase